jgi:TPR repeat protein
MAAERGVVAAQARLGELYAQGLGGPDDPARAADWAGRAAAEGHLGAMNTLASFLEHGRGVERQPTEAYVWYSLAAALGNGKGREGRERVRKHLDGEVISRMQARATELFPTLRQKFIAQQESARRADGFH